MLRDSLQKRLREMEKRNPSLSLETTGLKETIVFLRMNFLRSVEKVSQKKSVYGSVEDKVNDYKKTFEWKYEGESLHWLNKAIDEAFNGLIWVESSIRMAESYKEDKPITSEDISKVRGIWGERAPQFAESHTNYWLSKAHDDAFDGLTWNGIATSIRIAQDYTKIVGLELLPEKINEIRDTWETNAPLKAEKHIAYWLKKAAYRRSRGEDDSADLRIANEYRQHKLMNSNYNIEAAGQLSLATTTTEGELSPADNYSGQVSVYD